MVIPPLLWAAFRFDRRGAVTAALFILSLALWGTLHGTGPFATSNPVESVLLVQVFMGIITMTNLVLMAVIAQHKRAESILHVSQERWQFALEGAGDGVWDWDITEGKVEFSKRYKEMLGYTEAEIGNDFSEWEQRVHPEDLPGVLANLKEFLSTDGANGFSNEFRMRCKDGGWKWILARGMVTRRAADGQPLRMIGTHADMTERKRMEIKLRENEERYRAVVEDQTEVICRLAADGTFRFVNDVYCRFFGKTQAELLGAKWQPVAAPEDLPLIETELGKLSLTSPVVTIENRVYAGDGQLYWMQFVNRGFFDAAGCLLEIQSVGRDITGRKRAEELFKEGEAWSQKVLDTTLDAFFRLNQQGQFLDVNETYCRLIGYTRAELLTMRISDVSLFAPTLGDISKQTDRIINLGGDRFESRHRCKDGRIIEFEVVASHFKLREHYVFGFLRDVTERKQLERQVFEISANERQRIGYDLHDGLGQHLAGIAFKTKALEENLAAVASDQTSEAEEIVRLLNEAINQTRNLARMLAPVEVEANGLLAALENLAAETKNIFRVDCVFHSSLKNLALDAQTGMTLYRITQEAIHNAINRGAAKRVEVRLETAEQAEQAQISLIIRDNGKGFVTETKPKTGMGLRIMQYRANSVGGHITIHSQLGMGTEVRCAVPRLPQAKNYKYDKAGKDY